MLALLTASMVMLAPPERPRDVWVFRSVLDKRARMVTLALHEGLWVAYDATNCGLYKAWDGDVAFEGAVYTAVHGPQPRSVGGTYVQRNPDEPVWYIRTGGKATQVKPAFKGYRIVNGTAILQYDIPVGGKKPVRVEESPEYLPGRTENQIGLERTFRVKELPAGVELLVGIPEASTTEAKDVVELPLHALKANGELKRVSYFTRKTPAKPVVKPTEPKAPTPVGPAVEISSLRTRPKADGDAESAWGGVPGTLITHRFEGSSFNADDLRAEAKVAYDSEGLYIWVDVADNVVRGADGITLSIGGRNGEKTYTMKASDGANRQPEIVYATKKTASGYVVEANVPWAVLGRVPAAGEEVPFNLYVTDEDGTASQPKKVALIQGAPALGKLRLKAATVTDQPEDRQPREPGLAVRVYWTDVPVDKVPKLAAGQTPNVNFVSPTINFSGDSKFGGFGDNYVVHVTGFLRIPETGEYELGLSSDDGSNLYLDGKQILDHDGLHGNEEKSVKLKLQAGEYPIRIEYFEAGSDEELHLGWKRPGGEFEIIPSEFLSTPRGEVRVTSPGRKNIISATRPNPPGDRRPLEGVHPSYDLATIRPPDFRPRVGGMDFLPDGRLVVCTWDADGAVYVLDGVRANGPKKEVTVKRIAAGLAEPLGLKTVGKRIFVLQKQELTELIDLNGDDLIDEYHAVANGWGVTDNFHEFAFGLVYKDGFFYGNLATAINPGGTSTSPQNPDRGKTIKIGLDGKFEFMAHGLRTPNGIGLGYRNDIFLTDNQGDWLPSSKLLHLTKGAFFGNRSVNPTGTANMKEKQPVVWMPQGEIGNSPSTPLALNDGPYRGQMVVADVTYGGVQRVYVEEVDRQYQGAIFRMTQGLEAGINRLCWGPDGALYVGGIGSTGNWGQTGKERFGLQRLKYNGKSTFEMLAVRARTNGFEIEFTEPLAAGNGEDASSYYVDQFRYQPTKDYGGPKLDEEVLPVKSVTLSADRKRAFLELGNLKPEHVVHIRLDQSVKGQSGQNLWSTETWYTLNAIPQNRPGRVDRSPKNEMTAQERAQGFTSLNDASSWVGLGKTTLPAGWKSSGGIFALDPKVGQGGDVMTKESYGDFELRLDAKVGSGGNSGIFYRVDPKLGAPWASGPEYQVLDNERHPDGQNPKTSVGSNYAMNGVDQKLANGAGQWNEIRIVVKGNNVEHWLNGKKVVAYTLGSPEWESNWKNSKFADLKEYGRKKSGQIVLQDHGDAVWFRNIRIKKL